MILFRPDADELCYSMEKQLIDGDASEYCGFSQQNMACRSHLVKPEVRAHASTDYYQEIGALERYRNVLVAENRVW